MRTSGLVVMALAAALVVGYAFYILGSSDSSRRPPSRTTVPDRSRGPGASADQVHDRTRGPAASRVVPEPRPAPEPQPAPEPRPALEPRPVPERETEAPRPTAQPGPPPRPEPEISLSEARERFANFMTELERLEADDAALTSTEWVDYYRRGHEALLPLQQHLDWAVPEEATEMRHANTTMRDTLQRLEPVVPLGRTP